MSQAGGIQETLRPYAILSILVYTIGIPFAFACILYRKRVEIRADQALKEQEIGDSADTNPNFSVRRRYQELYNLFRPGMAHWRLVITLRKFCLISIGLMFSYNPLFQAWYVVGSAS
jgi:hypothetical protein